MSLMIAELANDYKMFELADFKAKRTIERFSQTQL